MRIPIRLLTAAACLMSATSVRADTPAIQAAQLSHGAMTSCSTAGLPPAVYNFSVNDNEIWLNLMVTNAATGDVLEVQWLDPNGIELSPFTFRPLASPGQWCFWVALANGSTLPASELITGIWSAQMYWNGALLDTLPFPLVPAGCVFSIGSSVGNFSSSGGSGSIPISTASACPWVASTSATWIHFGGAPNVWGFGTGSIGYTVDANTSSAARTGTIQTGGFTYTVAQAAVSLPDLTVTSFTAPTTGVIGANITGQVAVANIGTANAAAYQIEFYLAQQPAVTASDIDTGWGCSMPPLAAGASTACGGTIGIPANLSAGIYYIAAIVNPGDVIAESNYTNNVADSSAGPITLTGGCAFTLGSNSAAFASTGGAGTISVQTGTGCAWTASSSASWVQITSGASGTGPGTVGYSVLANSANAQLTGTIQVAGQTFTVTQAAGNSPVIATGGIADPWTYTTGIAPGAWISIYGANLSSTTASWAPQANEPIATTLGGVSVTIDGIPAALSFVDSYIPGYSGLTQINALVPGGIHVGTQINVVVTSQGVAGPAYAIQSAPFLPSIFNSVGPGTSPVRYYVNAVDPTTGELLGNVSANPSVVRAVSPGDTIDLYAIGLGAATPEFPTDTVFSGAYSLVSNFNVVLAGVSIAPTFAALISPGLYQVRIVVPQETPAGDQPILFDFGSAQSAKSVYLTIQQ
jgi:uncharacterized protein (TIGR03437 family)